MVSSAINTVGSENKTKNELTTIEQFRPIAKEVGRFTKRRLGGL